MSRNCQIIVQEEREEWERLSTVVTLNTSRTRAPLCSRFFNQRSRIVSRRKGFSEGSTSLKVTILTIVPLVVIRTPIRAIYYNRAWASTCYVYVVWSQQSLCFLRSFPPSSRRVFFSIPAQGSSRSFSLVRGTGRYIFSWQSAMTVGVICIRRCMFHQFTLGKHATEATKAFTFKFLS